MRPSIEDSLQCNTVHTHFITIPGEVYVQDLVWFGESLVVEQDTFEMESAPDDVAVRDTDVFVPIPSLLFMVDAVYSH